MKLSVHIKHIFENEGALKVLFFLIPFLYGGYYSWCSAIMLLAIIVLLAGRLMKNGRLELQLTSLLVITALLPLSYALSCIWAVDHGEAPFGILRTLPLPLLVLLLQQTSADTRTELLRTVPFSGAVMTVLSGIAALIPQLSRYFLIDSRLSGFFQYPNVYALFMLAGLMILSWMPPEENRIERIVLALLLGAGLLLSGSRTVFILAIAAAVLRILLEANLKVRLISFCGGVLLLAAVLIIANVFPASVIGRYLKITANSSTMLGRFLYWQDAIPVILHHPFGMGYLGYYYSQGSFQTGVYSTRYVHNSLLQLLLDIGWLPALLIAAFFAMLLLRRFLKKDAGADASQKRTANMRWLLLVIILAHSFFDFSLEFVSIWMLLLTASDAGKVWAEGTLRSRTAAAFLSLLLGGFSVYFGIVSALEQYASPAAVLRVYPADSAALSDMLMYSDTAEERDAYAQRLVSLDDRIALAHSALARSAYSRGDVQTMVSEEALALECAKYSQEGYQAYFDMLQVVYGLFQKQGDHSGAEYCMKLLQEIPVQMQQVLDGTSSLGLKIKDTPELSLTADQLSWLEKNS